MQLQVPSPMNLISDLERAIAGKKQPAWKLKIMNDIETKRKELSIIAQLEKGSRVKERKIRSIENKYKLKRNQSITELKEIIKQKMQSNA